MKKIILSMVLVGMLFLVGCQVECPDCVCPTCEVCEIYEECEVCEEIPEEKAMLDVVIYQYAINEYNEDEMFFDFFVYNYGNIEAKNVYVKCTVDDLKGKRITTTTQSIGNIASNSYKFEEITTKAPKFNFNEEYIALCYVKSCNDCEILYKRIPELKNEIE